MKRTWTIIEVGDVPDSFKWYQVLFGQPTTLPANSPPEPEIPVQTERSL
jgi:hypothetical protein